MNELTGKQKRILRANAQSLSPVAVIGKGGLSASAVENVNNLLSERELIKVKLPQGGQRKLLAAELATAVGAACVGVVGRTAILYRPNDQLDSAKRIHLPE